MDNNTPQVQQQGPSRPIPDYAALKAEHDARFLEVLKREQEPNRKLLDEAIEAATPERLREMLRATIIEFDEAFEFVCSEMLVDENAPDDEDEDEDEEEEEAEAASVAPAASKRKIEYTTLRYEVCRQCNEEYDASDNTKERCVYHPGTFFLPYK